MSTTNTDRFAKQLAKDWGLSLSAARDIRAKQIESGVPSVNDLMPDLLRHYDHNVRDYGELCLGVQLLPSRIEWSRWTVPGTDVRALVGTTLVEGSPVFAPTSTSLPAVTISGGSNAGKTTMLHSLIEQAVATTSPIDTRIIVMASEDSPIRSRVSHLDRIQLANFDVTLPDSGSRIIVFIDDADLYLPANPGHWRWIAGKLAENRETTRVYATAATAAQRVLPSALISDGHHVHLRGSTLPFGDPAALPWRFDLAHPNGGGNRNEWLHGVCLSDLPAGNSPFESTAKYRAIPGVTGQKVYIKDFDPGSPESAGIERTSNLVWSPDGRLLVRDVEITGVNDPIELVGAGETLVPRLMLERRDSPRFEELNREDDVTAVISGINALEFPVPLWRACVGRFVAEDPGTWDHVDR